jgi:hypothetical protein
VRLELLDELPRIVVRLEFVNKFLQRNGVSMRGWWEHTQCTTLAVASSFVRCLMTLKMLYLRQQSARACSVPHAWHQQSHFVATVESPLSGALE